MIESSKRSELLIRRLTEAQPRLYSFILSLFPSTDAAMDILQETNLVLWRKSDEFQPDLNFLTWACRVARYQVMAYRRDRCRDKHLFNDDLLSKIALVAEGRLETLNQQQAVLERCLGKLRQKDRDLIRARYAAGGSVQTIAAQLKKTVNAVSRSLYRIRIALIECVEKNGLGEGL